MEGASGARLRSLGDLGKEEIQAGLVCVKDWPSAAGQPLNNIHMLTYILIAIAVAVFVYAKRHGFRRAWYILRTAAENPDWEELGGLLYCFLGEAQPS